MWNAVKQYFRGWVDHPHLGRRIAIACAATILMGVCVLALEWLQVGTDPFSCVCIGLSHLMGIDLQIIEPVVHAVTLCVVLFVARDLFGFGSLANIFLVGIAHDFILKNFLNSQLPELPETGMRILLFTVFAGLFLLAVSAYVSAELGTSPYDAAPIILHRKLQKRWPKLSFTVIRVIWDGAFALLGLALGGPFGAVTVACVIFLGPLITWMSKFMKKIVA